MEGIFLRKKFNIRLFLLFLCGLAFIGLYIFINIVDPIATNQVLVFLIIGIMICLIVIPSWMLNLGAFIHVDEDSIKAKYHWFGKIDCKLSEVAFVVAQINTLIIQLKDGKTHTIMGVANPWPLASLIRRNISFETNKQPEVLMEELNSLKVTKKKGIMFVCFGIALMFIIVFITVFLTGARETYEFSNIDWTIFSIMIVTEIATFIATLYFAGKTGKNNIPILKLQYTIQRTIIETQPLLPGFVIAVYTDENYTGRIILFGYPHDSAVYYSVQNFDSEYNLVQQYTSEIFENQKELTDGFMSLIDITDKVLH